MAMEYATGAKISIADLSCHTCYICNTSLPVDALVNTDVDDSFYCRSDDDKKRGSNRLYCSESQ